MKRYPLVIWDFDGTLVDSMALTLETFNALAAERGYEPITDLAALRRMRIQDALKKHNIPLWRVPFLIRAFLRKQREKIASVQLYPGISDIFKIDKEANVRHGILSSNARDNIEACLKQNDLREPFAFVEGYSRLFGKGTSLKKLLKREKAAGHTALYVGDEVRDIEAAREAGMDSAAVTWGFHEESTLTAAKPTYLCRTREELAAVLNGG